MAEQERLGAAIKTISEKYLGNVLAANDNAAILKWALRLSDYSSRLAALVALPLTPDEAADFKTVGAYTVDSGATDDQIALAAAANLSLEDWYVYWITKVQAALRGQIIGESAGFLAAQGNDPAKYFRETLNGGDIYMFSPTDPRDVEAKAAALKRMGLTSITELSETV